MKINLLFSKKKRDMNKEKEAAANTETAGSQIIDELKLASGVEASEQKPMDEDPTAKMEAELAEMKDAHLRLFAEFENYKRRTLKERSELIKNAGSDVIIAMLPVLDDFDRAMKSITDTENSALKEGIKLIHGKLTTILEQQGVKQMVSIGNEFNVDLHEAITNVEVQDEKQKGKVIDELEKGYYLNEKVIRYAKVIVGA
jgi:molecular chaperone GrpE